MQINSNQFLKTLVVNANALKLSKACDLQFTVEGSSFNIAKILSTHKATFATLQQLQRYINRYTFRKFYTYNLTTEIIKDEIDVDMVMDKIFDLPYSVDTKSSRWFICADTEIQNTLIELYKSFYYDENSSAFWSISQIATNNGLEQYELLNYLMCIDND